MPEAENGLDVIRGDVPLARYIFNDPRKRRLIPRLQEQGWPIFDVCGKRAARRPDLDAEVAERARSGGTAKTANVG
jgi:hypothetical protein